MHMHQTAMSNASCIVMSSQDGQSVEEVANHYAKHSGLHTNSQHDFFWHKLHIHTHGQNLAACANEAF